GQHALAHEIAVPGVELGARAARERRQLEVEELEDIQGPGLVPAEELVVARLVPGTVEHAAPDQELRPGVVAVAREQGVVEIEERQVHRRDSTVRWTAADARVYNRLRRGR